MNQIRIGAFISECRKAKGWTQSQLAEKLGITDKAVSKWETGITVPDLEVLLKISKLYNISINDILEPKIQPQRISDFEQISTIPENELREILRQFDKKFLVMALMGASPDTNQFFEKIFLDIDFEKIRNEIGRIRVETVEEIQEQIVSIVNLQYMDRKIMGAT